MSAQHGFTAAEHLSIRRTFGVMLDSLTDREVPLPRVRRAAVLRALAEYDGLNGEALRRVADELDPPPEIPAEPDWTEPSTWAEAAGAVADAGGHWADLRTPESDLERWALESALGHAIYGSAEEAIITGRLVDTVLKETR
ncbi:MAG: hypothetical protein R2754_00145 [Microthrixaceae bacterium]